MINDQITNSSELTPLEVAKFILSQIIRNHDCIVKMSAELDSNRRLALGIIYTFTATGLVKRNVNGTYAITTKCKNVLERIEAYSTTSKISPNYSNASIH